MRKHVFGRQLQRDTNERRALFKSLMNALIIYEDIETTEAKAKAIKGEIEKLVTKAKKDTVQAEHILQAYFSKSVLRKFIDDIAPRFADRHGGYTRIIKIGNRLRDNAKMVMLEWVVKSQKMQSLQSQRDNLSVTSVESSVSSVNAGKKPPKSTVKKNIKVKERIENKGSKKSDKKTKKKEK